MAIDTSRVPSRATILLLLAILSLLLAAGSEGPDFGHYADWAGAALHGDIFDLRSSVLSPGGVPFTVAAPGTGLLFAIGKVVLFPLRFGLAAIATGWLAAVTFWTAALVVLLRVASGDWRLVLFGAGVLFVGTHAGLYSHGYATEVFANALIALLWALGLTHGRPGVRDCLAMGALAGLLLIVRAHVVLYALPPLWMAVMGVSPWNASPEDGARAARQRIRAIATRAVAAGIPMAIAVAQYAIVNRWMTGSPLHPPYVYGGAGFSSVTLRDPELLAVLVHPLHGLLSYHPAYGVAFAALVLEAWRSRSLRVWWSATLLAVIAHVWIQAGWYVWWLGGSTFGMRGIAPAALPLVAALIATIRRDERDHPARATLWRWLAVLGCAWSGPLLLLGNSQFVTWRALLDAQRPAILVVLLAAAAGAYAVGRARARPGSRTSDAGATGFILLAFAVAYLVWQASLQSSPIAALLAACVAGAILAIAERSLSSSPRAAASWVTHGLTIAILLVFVAEAALFGRLAIQTERYRASGAAPPRPFAYVGASPVEELRVTYAEYLAVPGFEGRKAAFRRFLAWQRVHATPMSPSDRRLAEAFRQRIVADPALSDVLIEATARDGVLHISGMGMSEAQQSGARDAARDLPGVAGVTIAAD